MVYLKNFVAAVKVAGKVLREQDDIVYIPFGSEYSLLLKNLASTKAVVSVSIDGKDVLSGSGILLKPNESLDLEGFLKNSKVTNRFKLIIFILSIIIILLYVVILT